MHYSGKMVHMMPAMAKKMIKILSRMLVKVMYMPVQPMPLPAISYIQPAAIWMH